jgi:hypothetical protein
VLVVVFMVSVEEPEPLIEAGLNPPLAMPVGNPDSLPTLRLTVPVKPVTGVTVTVNVVDWPGVTSCPGGLTAIEKSAVGGVTVIVRVGGLGSELPLESITVSEVTYIPGVPNVTFPGVCATDVAGDPPGKTHEYWAAVLLVLKETDPPAGTVTSEAGDVISPTGGEVAWSESWMNCAFDGTPALSSRNSM